MCFLFVHICRQRFWNRVPRFPINGTPCSTLKQIYVFCTLKFWKQYLFKNHLRLWFEMCSMFVCFVCSKSWSFTTLLIGCWQKVTWNDGTDICSKHKRPQEKPVNLDKRYEINVTAVTNTNCAAETNTSVHSSERLEDSPLFKWNS